MPTLQTQLMLACIAAMSAAMLFSDVPANGQEPPAPATESPTEEVLPGLEIAQPEEPAAEPQQDDVAEPVALPHPELMLGSITEGATSDDQWANFSFVADGPGLLTVVLRSQVPNNDMAMALFNQEGDEIASCDIDYLGDTGAEHFTSLIPAEGIYRVSVRPLSNGGAFWIGGSWIPYEAVADSAPARPGDAQPLTSGNPIQFQINGQNPPGKWFSFTSGKPGFLIIQTSANRGVDLQLDLHTEESGFKNYLDASDQDRQGDTSREQLSVELVPGQTYYFHAYDRGSSGRQNTVTISARIFVEQDAEPAEQEE